MPSMALLCHSTFAPHHGHLHPLPSSVPDLVWETCLASLVPTLPAPTGEEPHTTRTSSRPRRSGMPQTAWPRPTGHAPRPQYTAAPVDSGHAQTPHRCRSLRLDTQTPADTLAGPRSTHSRRSRRRLPPCLHGHARPADHFRHRPRRPTPPGEPPGHTEQDAALA